MCAEVNLENIENIFTHLHVCFFFSFQVVLLDGERVVLTEPMKFESSAIAFHPNGGTLAVGANVSFHLFPLIQFLSFQMTNCAVSN